MNTNRLQFSAYWEYESMNPARLSQTGHRLEDAARKQGLPLCAISDGQRGRVFSGPHAELGREYLSAGKNTARMDALSRFRVGRLQNNWYDSFTRGTRYDASLIDKWLQNGSLDLVKGPGKFQDLLSGLKQWARQLQRPAVTQS